MLPCVLPEIDGKESATFTTTPLYHGGIAECFRAWMSRALVWLFPAADLPITAKNIISSLFVASQAHLKCPSTSAVKYFSGVPYVLQMLADDSTGMDLLLEMGIVGVGGAALPQSVGNMLINKGVNLVSRLGSAECGFLLSSYRPYKLDGDWQYLRVPSNNKFLHFEAREDGSGLSELVILKGWPHMAKTNREDSSFATKDLFEPHPTIEAAWRYHSRSDSQITLITGKKFDPAPLEDAIAASSSLIKDVLVFGNGRQVPGALIFPSRLGNVSEEQDVKEQVWAAVDEVNRKGQSHTRILRDMLVFMRQASATLRKSSKGNIIRGDAEKKFAKEIERAYAASDSSACSSNEDLQTKDIRSIVRNIVHKAIGGERLLTDEADFYHSGCDSARCTRIRTLLQQEIMNGDVQLPWNIVYDCGNIHKLSEYLIRVRDGLRLDEVDETREMMDLVDQFSHFSVSTNGEAHMNLNGSSQKHGPHVVLLTGATGALGAHILDLLRSDSSVTRIICFVRANNSTMAHERVSSSLVRHRKAALNRLDDRIICFNAQLGIPDFGLLGEDLAHIRENVNLVIHAAWAVNFSLQLHTFVKDHIAGLQNLIELALKCTRLVSFSFCSSTASVLGPSHPPLIPELISTSPSEADSLGYSRSKWVAEAICSRASTAKSKIHIKIFRIGQLTGDTENGVWNMSEAWPLMLSTVNKLGCLPRLKEPLSWLPLDITAKAVMEIATSHPQKDGNSQGEGVLEGNCPVYHLVSNSRSSTWKDLLHWLRRMRRPDEELQIVEPGVWLEKLEALENHPAKNLLGLWKKAFEEEQHPPGAQGRVKYPLFDTRRAERASSAMKHVKGVDEELFVKIWTWMEEEMKGGAEG